MNRTSLVVGENIDFHNEHSADSDKYACGWQKILSLEKPILVWNAFNIDRNDSFDVSEALRNALPCGSDSYRRVYLKVREWLFISIEKTLWFERGKRGKHVNKVTQEPSFLVCEQCKFWEIVSGRRFWLENFQRKSAMVKASKS